jgi:plastocyanin
MSRVRIGGLIVAVALLGLAPAVPAAASSLAQYMGMDMGMSMGMAGAAGSMLTSMRGCGQGQQNAPASAIAELPKVNVNIYDGSFVPSDVTIPAGTIVVWTNRGTSPHTSTAWNRWDSGILRPGQACMAWFVTPGTYQYLSIVAADGGTMTGSVTVSGALP